MKWYNKWAKKRQEVVTSENYSSSEDFQSTAESFPNPVNCDELNPSIDRLGLVGDIASGKTRGFYYARTDHPNFAQLEHRVKELEVGRLSHPEYFSCKVFPSGMAAIKSVLEAIALEQEGTFIHGKVMYPSTKELLKDRENKRNMLGTYPGVEVDLRDSSKLSLTIHENQLWGFKVLGVIMEPVANPTLDYADVREVAKVAHSHDVPVIVDNTFLTPYLLEPFRMSADVVVHSLTKYFSGQGDMTGGAVIMPNELEPAVQEVRRHGGAIMSIRDAHEFSKRVPLVGQRMKIHSENARTLAKELKSIEEITVNYNDLRGQTRNGYAGGVLPFVFNGTDETAYQRARNFSQLIIDNPGIAKHAVSFGEPQTLAAAYAGLVDIDYLQRLNIPTGLVRIAVGRENDYDTTIAPQIKRAVEKSLSIT